MSELRTPYRDDDVLAKWDSPSWDDTTRDVVRRRLHEIPTRQFFTEHEWALLQAVCDRLVPQPDRHFEPVPIVPWIDRKLHDDQRDGYRYADMPPMREAWRLGIGGIDAEACARHGEPFTALATPAQDDVLRRIQHGEVTADVWKRLPPERFFTGTLLKTVVGTYYSHPAAWSECGFGGPASPRGYVRLGPDEHDPWEATARPADADA